MTTATTPLTRPTSTLPTPSRMGWDAPHVREVLTYLESLPRPDRLASARARIRDREAELAILADAAIGPSLLDRRVDDELLTGLYLVLLLT